MIKANPKHPKVSFGPYGRRGKDDLCWMLEEMTVVEWHGFKIVMRKGMLSDMGSVPRMLWPIVPPTGPGNLAFLTHDKAYGINSDPIEDENGNPMTREEADRMMYDLLLLGGMSKWRAFVAWRGVRRGGWLSWQKKAPSYFAGAKKRRKTDV